MRRSFLVTAALAATLACGSPPEAETPGTAASSAPAASSAVRAPGPDLSPVARPKSVFLVARMPDVGKSLDAFDWLMNLPVKVRALVDGQMKQAGAGFLDLSASLDVAVIADPRASGIDLAPRWAVSIPLRGAEAAVAFAHAKSAVVTERSPGVFRAKDRVGKVKCDVAPALGDAPYRAVCSDHDGSLTELTPWMTRGLAAEPRKDHDVWARLELAGLKERYLPLLKEKADPALALVRGAVSSYVSDPELIEVPGAVARELFAFADDVDAVELSFTADAQMPALKMKLALSCRSKESWITKVVQGFLDDPQGPPEMFFRLPNDATAASWSRAADPALFTGVRSVFRKSVEFGLGLPAATKAVSDADRKAILHWVDAWPSFSGVWVTATGEVAHGSRPAAVLTAQDAVDAAKSLAQSYLGWSLSGGEGDMAPAVEWLKATDDAMRRGVADIKKALGPAAKLVAWLLPTTRITKDPAGYPKGTTALDLTFAYTSTDVWDFVHEKGGPTTAAPQREARGQLTLRVVVAPDDAGHYWWGYATDEGTLKSKLSAVAKGAPAAATLSARADLESLKSEKGYGGFITLTSILSLLKHSDALSADTRREIEANVGALPHKAGGPIFIHASSTGGDAPKFGVELTLGKEMLEDISALVTK